MIHDEGTGLGDVISRGLAIAGITEERLEAILGVPCGCSARIEKLNAFGAWATRLAKGRIERAVEFFEGLARGWS